MGKMKKGPNEKSVDAKASKDAAKASKKEKEARDAEDADWRAAGEGKLSKAQAAKEKQAAERAEAAAKKAEAKKLAAEEEEEMARLSQKKAAAAKSKVTAAQLAKTKEADTKARAAAVAKQDAFKKREVAADDYATLVDTENVNRQAEGMEARSVTDAIAALSTSGQPDADPHPERRMKAAHLAFEEEEIKRLRQDKPGLRTSQYKDMAWKAWQKSPSNPLVQAQLAAQQSAK